MKRETRLSHMYQQISMFPWSRLFALGLLLGATLLFSIATAVPQEQTLTAVPDTTQPGASISLQGTGYTPGGYQGTIRWQGVDRETFTIPNGGAFSQPFIIPADASAGEHAITVCAGTPCFTGEFEQLATVTVTVEGYVVNLPTVMSGNSTSPPAFETRIDTAVPVPTDLTLPELEGEPRPLAAVADELGNVATFVANEIVVQTDDTAVLDAILTQYEGTLLLTSDPAEAGIADLPPLYLVRVNLDQADLANLEANVVALDGLQAEHGMAAGEHRFSGEDGARLIAIASETAVSQSGASIGVNWVSPPTDASDTTAVPVSSIEAPGSTLGDYTSNAYNWHYMNSGSVQDIGTADAWDALYYGDKLGNRVRIAILDGGFAPNNDFPTDTTYLNIFPFDPRNVGGVDGGAPWHGTDVLQTAVGVSDNNFGIVGVAHTVGDPIALYTSYDFFVSIGSVLLARGAGAKVMNMSYGAAVPAAFSWTVLPFEATTAAVRASGALLFASAGNDYANVDDETCFIFCWENTFHTPCENAGVICVGGLEWNSQERAVSVNGSGDIVGGSNRGTRGGVHIFAPYRVYRGQSPNYMAGDTTTGRISGTSFSSPYTAGVATLIWAANPALSANQVWNIMRNTAHTSPDPDVPRYVNAYDAVLQAMGTSARVDIVLPANNSTRQKGQPISFRADMGLVTEDAGLPLVIRWSSNVNGVLRTQTYTPGAGANGLSDQFSISTLSEGAHIITARITAGPIILTDQINITVQNNPPNGEITQPSNGEIFCPGEQVSLRGTGSDVNQPGGLPESAFSWQSSLNGNLGTGTLVTRTDLAEGAHNITLRVTDDGGLFVEDSVNITILAADNPACTDTPPSALITSPANGADFWVEAQDSDGWYATITFIGEVGDLEDNISDLIVTWSSDYVVDGDLGTPTVNPTTGETTITARLHMRPESVGTGQDTHVITLYVEDTDGNVKTDTIQVILRILI